MGENRNRGIGAEGFPARLILAAFAAALLLLPVGRVAGQGASAGPLPAATPSDQPPAPAKAQGSAQLGGKPNLAGTWTLNKDQSDDPRQKMQQAGNSGGQGGGGGRGGWGGRGGRQQGGGGMGQGRERGPGNMMNDFSKMTIEQTASSVKVTGASGRVLALYPGSSSTQGNSSGSDTNASAPPAAQWQGTQLVVVTQGMRGGHTTRTYELSPDGKQLQVTTRMENPRFKQPVTIRLVYDAVKAGG